jgi:hypothetical protein
MAELSDPTTQSVKSVQFQKFQFTQLVELTLQVRVHLK